MVHHDDPGGDLHRVRERVGAGGCGIVRALVRLEVEGPLPHSLVGVLAQLVVPLADAGVSVFPIATYDTDHVLVRSDEVGRAREALSEAGHEVVEAPGHRPPHGLSSPLDLWRRLDAIVTEYTRRGENQTADHLMVGFFMNFDDPEELRRFVEIAEETLEESAR